MLLLTASDVRSLLDPVGVRSVLAAGYAALSDGHANVPTRVMAQAPTGLLGAMPGFVAGVGLAAKLVSVFPDNAAHQLPTHMALISLFDEDTGAPLAVMDGEVVTEMRTSGSAALACELLAPRDAATLTIIGSGVQATGHLEAFRTVRPWTEIRLTNRTPDRARHLASRYPGITVVEDIDEAVRGADVVACTTDAPTPMFDPRSFTGSHLSTVGIHLEIPPELLTDATVVVQTRAAVHTPPPNGPAEVQGMDPARVVELGEIISGRHTGRTLPAEVTAWASAGHAMEDVVTARLAYDRALDLGLGQQIEL